MRVRSLVRGTVIVLCLGLFVYGLFLLSLSTQILRPRLSGSFLRFLNGRASALGLGWLAASVFMNGSTAAAVALTLGEGGMVSPEETFMMIAGSRLGAAFFVVLLGAWTAWRRRDHSLAQRASVGLLDFWVALSIYGPVALAGPWLMGTAGTGLWALLPAARLGRGLQALCRPLLLPVIDSLNPWLAAALGIGLVLGSLRWFEDAIAGVAGSEGLRSWIRSLVDRPRTAFLVGGALTLLTASVSVSVGILVPLYGQGLVRRRETVPYLLGANVTTLGDTLLAAVVLGSPEGLAVVGTMALAAAAVSLVYLLIETRYRRALMNLLEYVAAHRVRFWVVLILPGLVPLLMVVM